MGSSYELVPVYVGIAAEFLYTGIGLLDHSVFTADGERPCGTGFHAGRLLGLSRILVAQRSHLYILSFTFVVPGNIKGTGGYALFAADAKMGFDSHHTEFRMIKSAARTYLHAGRIGAVHAAVFSEEPAKFPLLYQHTPENGLMSMYSTADREDSGNCRDCLVFMARHFIPLFAGNLTAATGGAFCRIDQFYKFHIFHRSASYSFVTLTMKALYSGQKVFASPTLGRKKVRAVALPPLGNSHP